VSQTDQQAAALRQGILAGLERTIWTPPPGVSEFDRVEAVRLLGQFRDPVAGAALLRVLHDGVRGIGPPLGRLLRDTALDTLLRSSAQPVATVNKELAAYYDLWSRLRRGRLERNVIYDDIPLLVQHGRIGVLLRGYVLPLIALLVGMVLGVLFWASTRAGQTQWADLIIGPVLFVGLGLTVFSLHQIGLVLLVAWFGARLPLPHLPTRRSKALLGGILAGAVVLLSLYILALLVDITMSGAPDAGSRPLAVALLALPLLALPCYMLAHDLETGAHTLTGGMAVRGGTFWAGVLRWASGVIYVFFVFGAFSIQSFTRTIRGQSAGVGPVLLGITPYLLYLLLAPVLVLLLLSALGALARARGGPRAVWGARP
jgi:hypothetical protein